MHNLSIRPFTCVVLETLINEEQVYDSKTSRVEPNFDHLTYLQPPGVTCPQEMDIGK